MSPRTGDRPDSARSWAIAVAAFAIDFLLSGISRTTGLFYVALKDTYRVSRMEANLPFTLRTIVRNLLGPPVGAIGQRYGARGVTMVGVILAALGVALCAVAPNVRWICVFWGGIYAIGVALGNTLFEVIVSQYFEKHRATATGLATSGSCVGSVAFPLVMEYMLAYIGLSGTFLITGALILHAVPAGILIQEPPWTNKSKPTECLNSGLKSIQNSNRQSQLMSTARKQQSSTKFESSKDDKCENICTIAFKRTPSNHDINIHQGESFTEENYKNSLERQEVKLNELIQKNLDDVTPSTSEEAGDSIYHAITDMCCDPLFYMISISFAAFVLLFDPLLTVIVDYMTDKDIQEAKYFISIISIGDFAGRLCFGWITDRNFISVPKFMILVHVIQGLTFGALPFFHSFETLMTLVVICGLAGGANVVMFPILVGKYLTSVQSLAIGSISFLGGIVQFGIPPMIGYFRDKIGSYDGLSFIIGGLSIVAGLLWILEPLLLKMKRGSPIRRRSEML